jgi:hypothetical protein
MVREEKGQRRKLDRLARSTIDMLEIIAQIGAPRAQASNPLPSRGQTRRHRPANSC